jgi:hypothetical protein
MEHRPIYLIVSPEGRILHETPHKPVDDLLIRAFTDRVLAPIQGYKDVRPSLVEAFVTRIIVDCGVLGETAADIVYVVHQLPWGDPDVQIKRVRIFNRIDALPQAEQRLLEIKIADDLIARELADETAPQSHYTGDAA